MSHGGDNNYTHQGDHDSVTDPLNQSIASGLRGENPNLQIQSQPPILDASVVMNSLLENMTMQTSTYHIPEFNGKTPPLKEFIQDVCNGAVFVTQSTEPVFIKAVLCKLKGVARESVRDKQFLRVNDLITHLKKRFAPSKKYQWYFDSIVNLRMTQNETVSDYYDRLQGLISGARHTLEEKYTVRYGQTKASEIMLIPVIDCALDAFIRGLPEEMSKFVDTRNPKDLSEAIECALHIEERENYTHKSRNVASSFHVSRRDEESPHQRSPSPFSKQSSPTERQERKGFKENAKSVTFDPNSVSLPSGVFAPPTYAQLLQQYYGNLSQLMGTQPPFLGPQVAYNHYGMQLPYANLPTLPPYPANQLPLNSTWKGYGKPPSRSSSPSPSKNLNSQLTPGQDATTSPVLQERPNPINYPENSIGSFEQGGKRKTLQ